MIATSTPTSSGARSVGWGAPQPPPPLAAACRALESNALSSRLPLQAQHWRELHDAATGRLIACRPAGSPAGSFPHTPW